MKKKYFFYSLPLFLPLVFLFLEKEKAEQIVSTVKPIETKFVQTKEDSSHRLGEEKVSSGDRAPAQASRRELPSEAREYLDLRKKGSTKKAPTPAAVNITGEYLQGAYQNGYQFLKRTRAYKLSKEIIERFPNGHQHLGFWIAQHDNEIPSDEGLDVVYNDQRNTYAVLTGILKVKYADSRDVNYFRAETQGDETEHYEHISSALYKYQDKAFLFRAQKLCLDNPSLDICEVELLEHDRGSR